MAPGDTQEVIVARQAGQGADRLSSITVLRSASAIARLTYTNHFGVPNPPAAPVVATAELDRQVVLSWGDPAHVPAVEAVVENGFAFEGYNVYELPGPAFVNPVRLRTFDKVDGIKAIADTVPDPTTGYSLVKIVQRGADSGIRRAITIDSSVVWQRHMANGTPYYFAVTAYSESYTPTSVVATHSYESQPVVFKVVPHSSNPGTRYPGAFGDTIHAIQSTAIGGLPSEGSVNAFVVDPSKLTGHQYQVTFELEPDKSVTWALTDKTDGRALVRKQTNQSGDDAYLIADGIMVKAVSPTPGMKPDDYVSTHDTSKWGWLVPSGSRRWTWAAGANGSDLPLQGFPSPILGTPTIGASAPWWGGSVQSTGYRKVLLKLASTDTSGVPLNPNDTTVSWAYRYLGSADQPAAKQGFAPFIKNTASSYAFQDYVRGVPLAAYDIDAKPPQRLALAFLENNVARGLVDGRYWPPVSGSDNSGTDSPREWLWIMAAPYTGATPATTFQTNIQSDAASLPLMWVMIPDRFSAAGWAFGDQFEIIPTRVNSPSNTFTFTAPLTISGDAALAKADVGQINVFPNPFFGYTTPEIGKYDRFVTFSHLPAKATVRIFTLAGVLVRTLIKDDPTQFLPWDLKNESGGAVAGGMYVAHVAMPDLGSTKILKLGVVRAK
jgi:hypothetical protein